MIYQLLRRNRRRVSIEWGLLACALTMLAALLAADLSLEYTITEKRHESQMTMLARMVNHNLSQRIDATHGALDQIRNSLQLSVPARTAPDAEQTSRMLEQTLRSLPGVRTLVVLDARGRCTASSRRELIGLSFADRDYFKVLSERRS